MPCRLLRPYAGQNANTIWWGSTVVEDDLKATGTADDFLELASDYWPYTRTVTTATANVSRYAETYLMNSASAQTLTMPLTGYWGAGKVLTLQQLGAGATTVTGAAGVTIVPRQGLTSAVTKGQGYLGQLIKESPTQWGLYGGFGG